MSTPTGDNAFLHDLEAEVKAELTVAESSPSEEEAAEMPMDEWMFDPAYAQSEEVGLRNLLGAVEALEDGSRPDDTGREPGRGRSA
ncbi:hypothetical protein [Catellatospora chokoriensis]|uniref:Uncharacterized protein n=1 Tax=Catellatospora chokoriensis TaxID=310353 RepID=A0A8J3NQG9_9ACTN|nr:hypothetical protein [Catellatospora chokoriensis]GIF88885.1 hypothetical protein Cch02nite_23290 [Catellatospora chokoriensis]